jgi:hypothetical protein
VLLAAFETISRATTHLTLLSAKTAGISGHNPTTQAESSTLTWYAFPGHVIRRRTLPHFGGVFGMQAIWRRGLEIN